jgi:hypothetical protein
MRLLPITRVAEGFITVVDMLAIVVMMRVILCLVTQLVLMDLLMLRLLL